MSTAWETLWSIVGQSLPESGFPQVVLSFMQLIEENDAAAVYQCVSGYGAATAGEAVDAARILYTYINQLNPPLLPPSVVDTLCSASIPWNELMNVLHHIPSSHYAALYALLKHSYSVCAMYNLSPDLLAGYYSRALFKMRAEELRPLLSVLITNFMVLNEPHVSAVDNMIRPTLSEVVQSFLNVSSSPWHPPPAHELQTQSARLQKAFGPFTNSQLGEYTDAASNRGQNVAKPRPSTKSSDSSHLDQEAHEKNLELLRSLSLLQLSSTALTEKQLRSAKSELKHKIHAWEDAFRKRTHRAPTVHDKQPVREAYDTYKQLKLRLEATFAEKHYTGSTAAATATATAVNPTTVSSASPNTQQQAAGTSNSGTSSTVTNQNTSNTNGAGSYSQGTSIVASTAPALSRAHPAPHNSLTGNRHHNPGSASIGNSGTMPTAYSSSSNSTHSITQSSPAAGGALQQPASQGKSQNNESPPPQLSVSGTVPKPNVVSTRNTTNYGQISTGAAGVANKAANLEPATLAELKEEKHNLKKTLHEFEASIRAQYGRAPTKDDRRLMYSQYARYGELKAILQPTNN